MRSLAAAIGELDLLHDLVSAALCAADAVRVSAKLIDG